MKCTLLVFLLFVFSDFEKLCQHYRKELKFRFRQHSFLSVVVIHGRGEGILRREVHALCARLKYVKDYRLGNVGEGGYGVTVVTFA